MMTSKATKRKYVIKEVLDEFVLPEGGQEIVQVVSSCGNNLHQVSEMDVTMHSCVRIDQDMYICFLFVCSFILSYIKNLSGLPIPQESDDWAICTVAVLLLAQTHSTASNNVQDRIV